ncbi:acetyl-CoA carboxylase biotin carboxylase subunit family protein [Streptomyces sp. NPDC048639]|uniref:ATP-grasp domain-containing protein n=1 Tax=Streptomyces sp. NPDC048639 TaxID=3365581 RepID=UPI003724615B
MPKVLLFSRRPLDRRPLHRWLGDAAADVVLVTPREAVAASGSDVTGRFLGHRLVDDYGSWATDRIAEEAARAFGVDLVASTSEDDVLRAARLRGRLGLPGQHGESANAYRDKVAMKRLARAAGLPVPEFAPVDDPLDLLDFIDAHGFPVVVKPRSGAGAEGFAALRDDADLAGFLDPERPRTVPLLPGQWMAESFAHGDFFHVDGIMRGHEVVHCWPSRYNTGVAEHTRHASALSSVLLSPHNPRTARLAAFTADVVAALPPSPMPSSFHLEAWVGDDGVPVLCEIACRAGGGPIATTYERAFGVHLAKEGLRAQCGLDLTLDVQPKAPEEACGWVVLPPGTGRFQPPAEPCPVPGVHLTVHLEPGTRSEGMRHAVDAAADAVVIGDTEEEVHNRLEELVGWWSTGTTWT